MTLSELIAVLIDLEIEHGEMPIMLEVGGDGAIHPSHNVRVEIRDRIVLTSEPV